MPGRAEIRELLFGREAKSGQTRPDERAGALLRQHLSPAQLKEWNENRSFLVGKSFRVSYHNYQRSIVTAARPLVFPGKFIGTGIRINTYPETFDIPVAGAHRPPPGGPWIVEDLKKLLEELGDFSPFENHLKYETLHPFMDGNGRSGRALWAWQMKREGLDPFRLGFLHQFYYQTLEAQRKTRK